MTSDGEGRYHTLYSGTTVHGSSGLTACCRRSRWRTFTHRVRLETCSALSAVTVRCASASWDWGLAGSRRNWRAGDRWTFFEVDRDVERIARNPTLFTYLQWCGATCAVVIGDGRAVACP